MIFLTVGTHEPFDRLVEAVDLWRAERPSIGAVFGQLTDRARYRPRSFDWVPSLDPKMFRQRCQEAELIVAHAGMGSIITALSLRKPLVIMPRRGVLGETRNDHQYETALRFGDRGGIFAAMNEHELPRVLDSALERSSELYTPISQSANQDLIRVVRAFIRCDIQQETDPNR